MRDGNWGGVNMDAGARRVEGWGGVECSLSKGTGDD